VKDDGSAWQVNVPQPKFDDKTLHHTQRTAHIS
jgi:hypothetical protein